MNFLKETLNIKDILSILPHRYPFLMVDRVIDFKAFKYLRAIKNCTSSETCFQGHFINNPVFPGVLIVESMAQATAILIYKSINTLNINKLCYFVGMDNVRFKKSVIPGDKIFIEVFILKKHKKIIQFKILASVDASIVCRSTMMFLIKNSFI